jgi:phosphoglycolate phosphatase
MSRDATRYSLAIFDLDGTLIDSFPWFLRIVNDVAREFDFRTIAPDAVEGLRRAGARDILKSLDLPLWKVPLIATRMRALKREHLHEFALFPGASDMLRALRDSGLRLALVSSDSEANARVQLGGAAGYFTDFACGASLFGKASKFGRVVKRAGVTPAETIAIGDEIRDCEAARAAGIAFGAVAWGYADVAALRALNPDAWFDEIADIARTLPAPGRARECPSC